MMELLQPNKQVEPDMTDEELKVWAARLGGFARSKLTNEDGSLKPVTSDLQRNVPAPKLKLVE